MKQKLFFTSLFMLIGLMVNAQGVGTTITIDVAPHPSGKCYESDIHTYDATLNTGSGSDLRYGYKGTATGGGACGSLDCSTVLWTGFRWEIQQFGTTAFYNTTASKPKPPAFGYGTWVTGPDCLSGLSVFSGTGTQNTLVLPIELTQFDATTELGKNHLTWQTASESQNKGFDIERSADGSRFEKIGFVAGHGTTSQTQRYTFNDDKSPNGAIYYRLKQLDFDGRFEYSKTIAIAQKGDNAVSIFPNPSNGVLNISADDYEQAFTLVNSIGQIVLQGEKLDKTINLQALPNGFYYLKAGTQTMKVVKE